MLPDCVQEKFAGVAWLKLSLMTALSKTTLLMVTEENAEKLPKISITAIKTDILTDLRDLTIVTSLLSGEN